MIHVQLVDKSMAANRQLFVMFMKYVFYKAYREALWPKGNIKSGQTGAWLSRYGPRF